MTVQYLGNWDPTFRGFQPNVDTAKKTRIVNTSAQRPKLIKVRPLYFLKLLKLQKIKYLYFFHFWPLGRDIDDQCFLPEFTFAEMNDVIDYEENDYHYEKDDLPKHHWGGVDGNELIFFD